MAIFALLLIFRVYGVKGMLGDSVRDTPRSSLQLRRRGHDSWSWSRTDRNGCQHASSSSAGPQSAGGSLTQNGRSAQIPLGLERTDRHLLSTSSVQQSVQSCAFYTDSLELVASKNGHSPIPQPLLQRSDRSHRNATRNVFSTDGRRFRMGRRGRRTCRTFQGHDYRATSG